jgi:hypothetical protein
LNLQVLGFWTVPTDGQPDKKSVIFLTQAGPYWLNGTEVAEADPRVLNGLFSQAKAAASQGAFPSLIFLGPCSIKCFYRCEALSALNVAALQVAGSRSWARPVSMVALALRRTAARRTFARSGLVRLDSANAKAPSLIWIDGNSYEEYRRVLLINGMTSIGFWTKIRPQILFSSCECVDWN